MRQRQLIYRQAEYSKGQGNINQGQLDFESGQPINIEKIHEDGFFS